MSTPMNRRLAAAATLALTLTGCRDKTADPSNELGSLTSPGSSRCAVAVSPLAISIGEDGQPGTIVVQTSAGCGWSANSNASWIRIAGAGAGVGNGSLSYLVHATFAAGARIGTLTVADATVTVTQAAFSSSVSSPFVGLWQNEDPDTGGITRVTIRGSDGAFAVHMWGACIPECYWGKAQAALADADDGEVNLFWNPGFAERDQELAVLPDGRLRVTTHTRFTDNSGRQPYVAVDYFTPIR